MLREPDERLLAYRDWGWVAWYKTISPTGHTRWGGYVSCLGALLTLALMLGLGVMLWALFAIRFL